VRVVAGVAGVVDTGTGNADGAPGATWADREVVAKGASIDRAAKDLDRQVSLVWHKANRLGLRWSRSKRPA